MAVVYLYILDSYFRDATMYFRKAEARISVMPYTSALIALEHQPDEIRGELEGRMMQAEKTLSRLEQDEDTDKHSILKGTNTGFCNTCFHDI